MPSTRVTSRFSTIIRNVVPLGYFDGGINMTGLRDTGNIRPMRGDLIITMDRISSGEF